MNDSIFTVSELTNLIKDTLESKFRYLKIVGEISNFKIHSQSGHYYFTLKDKSSAINAVMWSTRNQNLIFTPEDGMQVFVDGRITVYAARGTYQVEVFDIKPIGIGELQQKFEVLKKRLYDEGLFDDASKKPIPKYPQNVAVITSKNGAALQDFIKVCNRRFPFLQILLFPVSVQGNKASKECINAINNAENYSKFDKIDTIIITRGGGSLEDLYPFNDEALARTVFKCKIPVISAIGHEVDFTICDFVADLRAPTPTAAAELLTPDINELIENISNFSYFYKNIVDNKLDLFRKSIDEMSTNYYFNRPKDVISNYYLSLDDLSKNIINLSKQRISGYKSEIQFFSKTLHHISPEVNLKKGYAIVTKKENLNPDLFQQMDSDGIVSKASQLKKNDLVNIHFQDDNKEALITN
jgi:exodeoxyribonuclease VII large subunit